MDQNSKYIVCCETCIFYKNGICEDENKVKNKNEYCEGWMQNYEIFIR